MKSGKWINKTAFFNGFIREELYMMQPEGFFNPKGANKVCKLRQSINELVQASRSWNIRFDELIKAYGFIQTFEEACIYKKASGSTTTFLIRAYSICAPNSLVVLSFPHASNFCSLFPIPLAETLTNVHNRRLPSWPLTDLWGHVGLC